MHNQRDGHKDALPRPNNVDIDAVRESKSSFERTEAGHHYVEKSIEGEYRLDGGPTFRAELHSDSSNFVVTSDEPKILGGLGVHPSPLSYLLYGVMACYAHTVAIQCALRGVTLGKMTLKGQLLYDVGPMLTDLDSPLIRALKIEVETDRDIREIIDVSNERCPALYAINHAIRTEVMHTSKPSRVSVPPPKRI